MSEKSRITALKLKVRHKSLDDFATKFASRVRDTGLLLPSKSPRDLGTKVRFEIRIATGEIALAGRGKVAEVTAPQGKSPGSMFVEFSQLEPETRALIDNILALKSDGTLGGQKKPITNVKRTKPRSTPPPIPSPQSGPSPVAMQAADDFTADESIVRAAVLRSQDLLKDPSLPTDLAQLLDAQLDVPRPARAARIGFGTETSEFEGTNDNSVNLEQIQSTLTSLEPSQPRIFLEESPEENEFNESPPTIADGNAHHAFGPLPIDEPKIGGSDPIPPPDGIDLDLSDVRAPTCDGMDVVSADTDELDSALEALEGSDQGEEDTPQHEEHSPQKSGILGRIFSK